MVRSLVNQQTRQVILYIEDVDLNTSALYASELLTSHPLH